MLPAQLLEIHARKARLCAKQFACPVIGSNPALGLSEVTCTGTQLLFCHRLHGMVGSNHIG
jgi:hypothetical protein